MPRRSARNRALENRAFLAALAETGNARLAAASLGVHRSTYLKRRARDPAFAARWDAALLAARLALTGDEDRYQNSPAHPEQVERSRDRPSKDHPEQVERRLP